ncbi:MAG TPA: SDR family oxidoreductase, partial [Agriterribacter sp.]|nr:SDR family oxidoreductase [Agriterribacter sp.]
MTTTNKFNLTGKKALITGGSRGLGFAIAKAFIAYGAEVIITGRDKAHMNKACKALGKKCTGLIFDLKDVDRIRSFVSTVEQEHGAVDILVNNAGIHLKEAVLEVSDDAYAEVIRINQQAVFAMSRECAKKMVKRKKGVIIMVSSMASQYGIPKVIAYTAAKSAVEGMTRGLAVELSPLGIRVNCIAPGFIATDMSS